jgi:hypothetical protein
MDVIGRVRRWAWSRPRVLLVDAPGADPLRWAVEAELDRRGWGHASAPAETDLLLVLGTPGEELSRAIDVVWSQVPEPRHRSGVGSGADVGQVLDTARDALLETATGAGLDEQRRPSPATLLGGAGNEEDDGHAGMGHEGQVGMGHDGHAGMGHDGHAGMDHTEQTDVVHIVHAGTDRPDHGGAEHTGHEHGRHREHGDAEEPGHEGDEHVGHRGMGHSHTDDADPEGPSHGGCTDHGGAEHGGQALEQGGHAGTEHEGHETGSRRSEVPEGAGQEGLHHGGADRPPHTDMGRAAPAETGHGGHAAMDHGGHAAIDHGDHAGTGHGGHGGMDHGGHGGMDHGSMEVAGLPMADTAPDRDGLQLDALAVALGPVLPGWPTGLLLRGKLQGDVLTDVSLSWVDAAHPVAAHPVDGHPVDGHHSDGGTARLEALDHLARFLDVAGWPVAARDARRARNGLRDADPDRVDAGRRRAVHLAHRVRRSRTLAWSVRGIGAVEATGVQPFRGDVLDRIRWWCEVAAGAEPPVDALPELPLERVAELLEGAELAAARLVVASLRLTRQETATPVAADVRTG